MSLLAVPGTLTGTEWCRSDYYSITVSTRLTKRAATRTHSIKVIFQTLNLLLAIVLVFYGKVIINRNRIFTYKENNLSSCCMVKELHTIYCECRVQLIFLFSHS